MKEMKTLGGYEIVDAVTRQETAELKARMDTFASLPEGSTTADAELADIRVGADGVNYQTAGEAVRTQLSKKANTSDIVSVEGSEKNKAISQAAFTSEINNVREIIGLPCTVAGGTVEAVAPAYTKISICGGIALEKGKTYSINAIATTESTNYAVYVTLRPSIGSDTVIGKTVHITHNNGSGSVTFEADSDYDSAVMEMQTSLATGVSVTASLVRGTTLLPINVPLQNMESEMRDIQEVVGIPHKIVEGTATAVSPAYSYVQLAGGISLQKDKIYTIRGKVDTLSTDYAVYIGIYDSANTSIGKNVHIRHDSPNGEASVRFTATADLSDLFLMFRSSLATGASVTASIEAEGGLIGGDALSLFNPFASLPLYHHLNQEDCRFCDIPAQSLFDVNYAKSLGFSMIEVNPQKCSDGVFVCKHGVGGTLGYGLKADDGGDYSNVSFASVSSAWLRSHIRYYGVPDKYSGYIPTLDEVCAECKKLSMSIKVSGVEAVEIARKYLPDDMIWSTQNERGDFKGMIEYVWYKSQSLDDCITACSVIGAPLNIVIAAGEFAAHTDGEITELARRAHRKGFTVGMVYPTSSDVVRALSLGVDAIGSVGTNINLFEGGDVLNVRHLQDTRLTLSENAVYDSGTDTIAMQEESSITVSADDIFSGKLSLKIRYSGSITINEDMTYESDGSVTIPYAVVLQRKAGKTYDTWLTIKANTATTIYEITLSCASL